MTSSSHGSSPAAWAARGSFYRFWFQPNDPTTLGFMRIMAGLVVMYVHFAYCFDLKGFFGPDGWWSADNGNRQRRETPVLVYPLGWHDFYPTVRMPEQAHRQTDVINFLMNLPDSPAERQQNLRYLFEIASQGELPKDREEFRQAMDFIATLPVLLKPEHVEMEILTKLKAPPSPIEIRREGNQNVPEFLRKYPEAEMPRLALDIARFQRLVTPLTPELRTDEIVQIRTHVLEFLKDQLPPERRRFRTFVDSLPEVEAERRRVLQYMLDWHADENQAYAKGLYTFSVWFHLRNMQSIWVVHLLILGAMFLFTIGLWTRVTSALTWFGSVMYIHRTTQVLFGMDTMMNILLLYLMLGPSGAALSVDRLLARYRASKALLRAKGKPVPWAERVLAGPLKSWSANFAIRMLQVHFCFIYLSAGFSKLKGNTWWDMTASWYTIANPEFTPIWISPYETLLLTLAEFRVPFMIFLAGGVITTLVVEIGFPFLVWSRIRGIALLGPILLHSAIGLLMGLTSFGLFMMVLILSYFPAKVIRDKVCFAVGSGRKVTLKYNPNDRLQVHQASTLRAMDVAAQLELKETADTAIQILDSNHTFTGTPALSAGLNVLVLPSSVRWLGVPKFVAVLSRWSSPKAPLPVTPGNVEKPKVKSVA